MDLHIKSRTRKYLEKNRGKYLPNFGNKKDSNDIKRNIREKKRDCIGLHQK